MKKKKYNNNNSYYYEPLWPYVFLGYFRRYLSYLTRHGYVNFKLPICTFKTVQPRILTSNYSDEKVVLSKPVDLKNIKEQSLETPLEERKKDIAQAIKEKLFEKKETPPVKLDKTEIAKDVPPIKKRKRVDLTASSMERNFITPVRAMSDFLLKPSDLESLPKTKRRSPYEYEPPITVYWRKDVEAKAVQVWGSKEKLIKERLLREIEKKKYQQSTWRLFFVFLRDNFSVL